MQIAEQIANCTFCIDSSLIKGVQFTIFGVLGISGGILSLWLPETKVAY